MLKLFSSGSQTCLIHSFILYSHSINPQKVTYETMKYGIDQQLQIYT